MSVIKLALFALIIMFSLPIRIFTSTVISPI